MIMNGFQSLGHNHSPSHHLCRRVHAVQIKLAASLTLVVILLLGTPTLTTSLPTPSSVDGVNNNRENSNNVNPNYFDNDQLLADWQQLCGWKKITNSSDALSLPVYVGSDAGRRGGSEEQVAEAIERLLRTIIANDGGEGDFASVTCEEEPLPSPSPQLALEATQNQKLFSNDNEFDERVSRDTNSNLPFGDDDIQRQVIFIEIPETKVNVHVHQSPPQTAIVVLPPMDDTHTFRIVDMRNPSVETATPNVHFLTNFGSNKIDSEISSGLQSNLHQMGQSQSIKVSDQRNFLNNQEHMPFKGVPLPISIPAAITARFNQQNQKHFQQINTNGAAKDFEIQPAYNGYFFH